VSSAFHPNLYSSFTPLTFPISRLFPSCFLFSYFYMLEMENLKKFEVEKPEGAKVIAE